MFWWYSPLLLCTSTRACSPTESPSIRCSTEPPWIRTSPCTTPPGTTSACVSSVSTDAPPAPRLASSFLNPMTSTPVSYARPYGLLCELYEFRGTLCGRTTLVPCDHRTREDPAGPLVLRPPGARDRPRPARPHPGTRHRRRPDRTAADRGRGVRRPERPRLPRLSGPHRPQRRDVRAARARVRLLHLRHVVLPQPR